MTPETFLDIAVGPALSMLPARMDSREARVMLVAICYQESTLRHRIQLGTQGQYGRGYPQFEEGNAQSRGGVWGVLHHAATHTYAVRLCQALDIEPRASQVHEAIAWNDMLALGFARLNLWWFPEPMATDEATGLYQYLETWRPGIPRPEDWPESWRIAQEAVA